MCKGNTQMVKVKVKKKGGNGNDMPKMTNNKTWGGKYFAFKQNNTISRGGEKRKRMTLVATGISFNLYSQIHAKKII